MGTRGYTVLGWIVWQVVRRLVRTKVPPRQSSKRSRVVAAAVVAAVFLAGVAVARAERDD